MLKQKNIILFYSILETDISSSDSNGKRRVGPAKLPGNPNKIIISQDDDCLSLFAPSDVEEELQQEEDNLESLCLWSMIQGHSQRAILMTSCAS